MEAALATSSRTNSSKEIRKKGPKRSRTFRRECHADGVNPASVSSHAVQIAPNANEKAIQLTSHDEKMTSHISNISVRCASSSRPRGRWRAISRTSLRAVMMTIVLTITARAVILKNSRNDCDRFEKPLPQNHRHLAVHPVAIFL
jgi:hypothetical protein